MPTGVTAEGIDADKEATRAVTYWPAHDDWGASTLVGRI
jgi:hypothetical protein